MNQELESEFPINIGCLLVPSIVAERWGNDFLLLVVDIFHQGNSIFVCFYHFGFKKFIVAETEDINVHLFIKLAGYL